MDEKRKEWQEQFNKTLGPKEYLRFCGALLVWNFSGAAISLILHTNLFFLLFVLTAFVFPFIATTWKPAYLLFRRISGNNNLPVEPMPRETSRRSFQKHPQLSFLPVWWLFWVSLLGYLVFRFLTK